MNINNRIMKRPLVIEERRLNFNNKETKSNNIKDTSINKSSESQDLSNEEAAFTSKYNFSETADIEGCGNVTLIASD